jgi:hypothetical protein
MKSYRVLLTPVYAAVLLVHSFFAASASAALITWNLNPNNLNQAVGSSSQTYTQSGYQIVASGYDNVSGPDTLHQLFYKSTGPIGGGSEIGLGLVGTLNNELQVNPDGSPQNYIQLDIRSLLSQGFTNGMISVGSVQPGEAFRLYGSNSAGSLGTQIGGILGSSSDDQFITVPSFGAYGFISVVSTADDVLPVAFRASIQPIPEAGTFGPIASFAAAVMGSVFIRHSARARSRRRA